MRTKLEVCVDSLESAKNAINGGADELEVCSSLIEGGITPSPGLVTEIFKLGEKKPVVNVMIRCRGGSDYIFNEDEMTTMLADIEFYKNMGVNRFVFGALMITREIDKVNCAKVIEKAKPIPVTFHRAFDICKNPVDAIMTLIDLGFDRILTSGHKPSAADDIAVERLKSFKNDYGKDIVIMPGAGINPMNVHVFVGKGFQIIHSSCKKIRIAYYDDDNSTEDLSEIYVTDKATVEDMIAILNRDK